MMKLMFLSISLNLTGLKKMSMSLMVLLLVYLGMHYLDTFEIFSFFSLDSVGWSFMALTAWIFLILSLMSSSKSFLFILAFLQFILFNAFSVSSFISFYIWFEASLVPTFALILGWGYQPERLMATFYLIFYTVFASLPLLVILNSLSKTGQNYFHSGMEPTSLFSTSFLIMIPLMLAFLVKLPLYFSHLWLIKAHVEAPVAGSMILASILLKLGGYGLIRSFYFISVSSSFFLNSMLSWALIGGTFASFLCYRKSDMKMMIALSSVAHMAIVAGGIFSSSVWGINGAVMIMLGHGFSSSGLFCIANMSYLRGGSRSFKILKGLKNILPSLTLWWFLLLVVNMAGPPTLNLLGEISAIISLSSLSLVMWLPISLMVWMAAAYSLALYLKSQHGKMAKKSAALPGETNEHLLNLLHWFPVNILILKSSIFIPWIF
uniref:NADH-ubiquinone oxidoreductase chain 4 n=1 Tax=Janira maculosa TaxID=155701 RepID=E3SXA5_9CRUS|nr:NADH dehydrogenase subunit 4 [Janira maculosa]